MGEVGLLQRWLCAVARAGPTPRHVAFIMDGNRRFARDRRLEVVQGHRMGYETLEAAVAWCGELGVQAVTVYAFSIENFKRSAQEVDSLMALCSEKLQAMCHKDHLIQRHGVRVRVVGDLELLSDSIRASMQRVMETTAHNTRSVLTVCFAYTSRFEIASAVRQLASSCDRRQLHPEEVTEALLERHMCTWAAEVPPVDLLIRTSGEKRLSDFLLWQSSRCVTIFTRVRWPELSLFRFLSLIIKFQLAQPELRQMHAAKPATDGKGTAATDGTPSGGDRDLSTNLLARWQGSLLLLLGAAACAASAAVAVFSFLGREVYNALSVACGSALAWTCVAFLTPLANGRLSAAKRAPTNENKRRGARGARADAQRPA